MLVQRCYQLFPNILSNGYFPRMLLQSHRIKIRWNRELWTDIVAFTLRVKKTQKKISQDTYERFSPVITSNDVPQLQMRSLRSQSRLLKWNGGMGREVKLGIISRPTELESKLHLVHSAFSPVRSCLQSYVNCIIVYENKI